MDLLVLCTIGAGCMILHLIEYCLDVCFGNKNDKEGK